ncbi:MAG: HAD family hydrolase [Alphaproteobacteria bacterium]|nr:HAD family hydrolase [Alphaproteobacteria bacterium]
MAGLTTIGFNADDTLWHNERVFRMTEARFAELLAGHAGSDHVSERLLAAERRNLEFCGYGIKGFTLSMIETAVEVTGGAVPASAIAEILAFGREMLRHPVEALPHAHEALEELSASFHLVLITKGDLFDQERKLAQSGLGDYFAGVEIVSEKSAETYARAFRRHGDGPARGMMVGNSLKSDVLPALAAGSWGVHVPHELTWAPEHEEEPADTARYRRLPHLGELAGLVRQIA